MREALYDLGGARCFPEAWRMRRDISTVQVYPLSPSVEKLWRDRNPLAEQVCLCFHELERAINEQQLLPIDPPPDRPAADVYLYLQTDSPLALAEAFFDQVIAPHLVGFGTLWAELPDLRMHLRRYLFDRAIVHLGELLKERPRAWRAFNRLLLEGLRDQVRLVDEGQRVILARLDNLLARPDAEGLNRWSADMADLLSATGRIEKGLDEGFDAVLQRVTDQHGEVMKGLNGLLAASTRIEAQVAQMYVTVADIHGEVKRLTPVEVGRNRVLAPDVRTATSKATLTEYRTYLHRLYAHLPLAGIPADPGLDIPLSRIFICPRIQHEKKEEQDPQPKPSVDPESARLSKREAVTERQKAKREYARHPDVVTIEDLTSHPQVVILGPAGSGKSTLMRYLARSQAADAQERLPLLVPLGRLDAYLARNGGTLLECVLTLLIEHKIGEAAHSLRQELACAIEAKTAHFFFDGLDEARMARQVVLDGLAKLIGDNHHLVITSRPFGYERLSGCEHYQLLPFTDEDVASFTQRWFAVLAEARQISEAERQGWASTQAAWLQVQVAARPTLREVAREPLFLTFLVILAGEEPRRDLPRRRVELYRQYIEKLLVAWEARHRMSEEDSLLPAVAEPDKARELALWGVYQTAWLLHRLYMSEEAEYPTCEFVQNRLAGQMQALDASLSRFQAGGLSAAILRFWQTAGLLDVYPVRGDEWLEFRHLTLQEFGAAKTLTEIYCGQPARLWDEIAPHVLDPTWAEVIALAIAELPEPEATHLVERLLIADATDRKRTGRVLLAAAALADGAAVAKRPREAVVDGVIQGIKEGGWLRLDAGSQNVLHILSQLGGDQHAVDHVLALTTDESLGAWDRIQLAAALGRMGEIDQAVKALRSIARDPTADSIARHQAIENMVALGRSEYAAQEWLAIAQDQQTGVLDRERAAKWLTRLEYATEAAQAWLAIARNSGADVFEEMATEALSTLERRDLLVNLVQDQTAKWFTRFCAIGELGKLKAIEELLRLGQDAALDGWFRKWTAWPLSKAGRVEEAVGILLDVIHDQITRIEFRTQAVEALGKLKRPVELFAVAQDETIHIAIRVQAIRELGKLNCRGELQSLATDEKLTRIVRVRAAEALDESGQRDQTIPVLQNLAREGELAALVVAPELGVTEFPDLLWGKKAFSTLLSLPEDQAVDLDLRLEATVALSKLGRTDEVMAALSSFAQDSTLPARARDWAAGELARVGGKTAAVEAWSAIGYDRVLDTSERMHAAWELTALDKERFAAVWVAIAEDNSDDVGTLETVTEQLDEDEYPHEVASVWLLLATNPSANESVCIRACKALTRLGQGDKAAIVLLNRIKDANIHLNLRKWLVETLKDLGRGHELASLVQDQSVELELREEAVNHLTGMKDTSLGAAGWLGMVQDRSEHPAMRHIAALRLAEMGWSASDAKPWSSIAHDNSEELRIREIALSVLARMDRGTDLLAFARDTSAASESVREQFSYLADLPLDVQQRQVAAQLDALRKRAIELLASPPVSEQRASCLLELVNDSTIDREKRAFAAETAKTANLPTSMMDQTVTALQATAHDNRHPLQGRVLSAELVGALGRVDEASAILVTLARGRKLDLIQSLFFPRSSAVAPLEAKRQAVAALCGLKRCDELFDLARERWIDLRIRVAAAIGLGKLGHIAEVMPYLNMVVQNPLIPFSERWTAGIAIGELDHGAHVLELVRNKVVEIRIRRMLTRHLGFEGRFCDLETLAVDKAEELSVRYRAFEALAGAGRYEPLLPIIKDRAEDWRVHVFVIEAIDRLSWMPTEVLTALQELAHDTKALVGHLV